MIFKYFELYLTATGIRKILIMMPSTRIVRVVDLHDADMLACSDNDVFNVLKGKISEVFLDHPKDTISLEPLNQDELARINISKLFKGEEVFLED